METHPYYIRARARAHAHTHTHTRTRRYTTTTTPPMLDARVYKHTNVDLWDANLGGESETLQWLPNCCSRKRGGAGDDGMRACPSSSAAPALPRCYRMRRVFRVFLSPRDARVRNVCTQREPRGPRVNGRVSRPEHARRRDGLFTPTLKKLVSIDSTFLSSASPEPFATSLGFFFTINLRVAIP